MQDVTIVRGKESLAGGPSCGNHHRRLRVSEPHGADTVDAKLLEERSKSIRYRFPSCCISHPGYDDGRSNEMSSAGMATIGTLALLGGLASTLVGRWR